MGREIFLKGARDRYVEKGCIQVQRLDSEKRRECTETSKMIEAGEGSGRVGEKRGECLTGAAGQERVGCECTQKTPRVVGTHGVDHSSP